MCKFVIYYGFKLWSNATHKHCFEFIAGTHLVFESSRLNVLLLSTCTDASPFAQKLVLQKQESLSTLVLQCPSLQEVDLTDCESLTDAICRVFSDGGGCPMLKSLILDVSEASEFDKL